MSGAEEANPGEDRLGGQEHVDLIAGAEEEGKQASSDHDMHESDAGPEHVTESASSRASAMLGFDPFEDDGDDDGAGPAEECEQTIEGGHEPPSSS